MRLKDLSIVVYNDRLIRSGYGGTTYGFVVVIRRKYRNDLGILAHEMVHAEQFWRTFCLFPIIYLLSQTWRLRWEVEAYREQLKWYEEDKTWRFAEFIATKYHLPITVRQAERLLEGGGA